MADKEEAFPTLRDLLHALGHECNSDDEVSSGIEAYADEYMVEDLGMNLFVDLGEGVEGEGFSLVARMSFYTDDAVHMWSLDLPVTIGEFNRYLDELDLRVARLRAIVELPTTTESSDNDEASIVAVLANLFCTGEGEVIERLGDNWVPVESDATGYASAPVRFLLWNDRLIVGFDDAYVHLFAPIVVKGEIEVGDVLAWFDMGEDATIGLPEFADALNGTLTS